MSNDSNSRSIIDGDFTALPSLTVQLKPFGILGGMGPGATAAFLDRFVRSLHKKTGATLNHEFPAITVQTAPAADYINDQENLAPFLSQLQQAFDVFAYAGAHFAVVPCNTAHLYLPLKGDEKVPVLSLLKVVENHQGFRNKRVLHLATGQTISCDLYGDIFRKQAATPVFPEEVDQKELHSIIWAANAGVAHDDNALASRLYGLINKYEVDIVFIACTELSLVRNACRETLEIIDSLDLLVEATMNVTTGERSLEEFLRS